MLLKRPYVAGPITQGDSMLNVRAATLAATELLEAGFEPFLPHINHFWHYLTPQSYERWLEWDFAWLAQCDSLIRLRGISPGSDREAARARELGLPVFYSIDEFLAEAHIRTAKEELRQAFRAKRKLNADEEQAQVDAEAPRAG